MPHYPILWWTVFVMLILAICAMCYAVERIEDRYVRILARCLGTGIALVLAILAGMTYPATPPAIKPVTITV